MPVSVIIPALNEAESIGYTVSRLPWEHIAECIVVDNGSTDDTPSLAAGAGARVIFASRGYGSACMAGVEAAMPTSDILVFMDGDGSDVTTHLPELTGPIARGEQDFVMGTRLGRIPREPGSMLSSQVFAGRFVGAIIHLVLGFRYTDMGPFRAIRRSSLAALGMRERTYGWSLEMQIKAVQHHLRILEIPVGYRVRHGGVSKVSGDFRASLRAGARILEVLIRVLRQGRASAE